MRYISSWLIFALFIVVASSCWGQREVFDLLGQTLALANSPSASERVVGFEQLGEYWASREQMNSSRFSDTPIEQVGKTEKRPELADDIVDQIAVAIRRGLVDRDSEVRKAAAIAICSAPRLRPEVTVGLTVGLNSDDSTVTWYVAQQAVRNLPPIEPVIQSLIKKLGSDDFSDYWSASDVLKAYGSTASLYAIPILDAILQSTTDRKLKMYVLCDIELPDAAASKLAEAATTFKRDELGIAAICLLDHPNLLKQIESRCPEAISALQDHISRLYPFLCKHQSVDNEARAWLAASDKLLPITMGLLREERFIEKIAIVEASASEYEMTFLASCKRACGANHGEQIRVDADHPVEFRPRSAWPQIDDRRQSKTNAGHGDGRIFVLLTGEVQDIDGTHPKSIALFRVNDGMLMGTEQNTEQDVLYDSSTGRFVFYTSIFAAYSMGKEQPEPGPYQTGSAQIRVEASGYQPLTLQFFDEMPDVLITLSPNI